MPTHSRDNRLKASTDAATLEHEGRFDYERVPEKFARCPDRSGRRTSRAAVRGARFKVRAVALHGTRYDYSAVAFVDQYAEGTILCRTHGPFAQRPTKYLDVDGSGGCPDCARHARPLALKDAWTGRTHSQRRDESAGEYIAA